MPEFISFFEEQSPTADLQDLAQLIEQVAMARRGDSLALLELLRVLEACHRQICETTFQDALPNNRHGLYTLLKDIETKGGWPYIQRMKLAFLLRNYDDFTPEETGE
ncbi:MAG: hypothetical protein VKO01_00390 [Cyanobacteriota bacterium]|jgi:hypothetical protein|nr:hypothetical protein [Cyanobacteriota bacterium]